MAAPTPCVWYVVVYVSDFERAVEFYEKRLGLPLRFRDDAFAFASFETAGANFSVTRADMDHPEQRALVGRHTGIGLGVPDLQASYEALRERGVEFRQPPEKQPWGGTLAMLADPDGNLLFLDQLRDE